MSTDRKAVQAGAADPDQVERTRADVYRLLAALLAAPADQRLLELMRGLEPETTAGTSMHAVWRMLRDAAEQAQPHQVNEEYFQLFIGLGRGELVPYASWYLNGMLLERLLASLRDELAVLGLERQGGVAEPEDHVAALCETMGMIISDSELSLREAAFFATYVDPWMGRFFVDLEEAEAAVFYKAVGRLGQQFLAVERQYFSLPV